MGNICFPMVKLEFAPGSFAHGKNLFQNGKNGIRSTWELCAYNRIFGLRKSPVPRQSNIVEGKGFNLSDVYICPLRKKSVPVLSEGTVQFTHLSAWQICRKC